MSRRGLRGPIVRWTPPAPDTPGDPHRTPFAFPLDGWGAVPECPGGSRRRAQIREDAPGADDDPWGE